MRVGGMLCLETLDQPTILLQACIETVSPSTFLLGMRYAISGQRQLWFSDLSVDITVIEEVSLTKLFDIQRVQGGRSLANPTLLLAPPSTLRAVSRCLCRRRTAPPPVHAPRALAPGKQDSE
jgi:hypothetical protein